MIKDVLENQVSGLLPKYSFGFRKGTNTIHCVNSLIQQINLNREERLNSIVIFLDISKAFNSVSHISLFEILKSLDIPNDIYQWLILFLKSMVIRIDTKEGAVTKKLHQGLLQGSTLSPILFNLYTMGIHKLFNNKKDIKIFQYADDFAIIITNKCFNELELKSNNYLITINNKLKDLNLNINAAKTKYQIFNHNREIREINIKLGRLEIEQVKSYTYLGITIDKNLNFTEHCNNLKASIEKRLQALRFISGNKFGGHPNTLMNITKALIFSKIYYGSSIYMGGWKINTNKIRTCYNKSIKKAMGFTQNTPSHIIYSEAGILPLELQVELLTVKDILKSIHNKNTNKDTISNYLSLKTRFKNPKSYLHRIVHKHRNIFQNINEDLSDNLVKLREIIWEDWKNEFVKQGQEKGKFYCKKTEIPRKTNWKELKRFKNYEAKIVNRVRAGYCIKMEQEEYICQFCNIKNDFIHKIFYCNQFNNSRRRYKFLQSSIVEMNWNMNVYKDILNFIKDNNIVI